MRLSIMMLASALMIGPLAAQADEEACNAPGVGGCSAQDTEGDEFDCRTHAQWVSDIQDVCDNMFLPNVCGYGESVPCIIGTLQGFRFATFYCCP